MEAIVLEIYDRRGHVKFRQKLGPLPATLGRAVSCDVIIDDPLVSSTHARLEEDPAGGLALVDAGSRNGLLLGGKKVARITLPATKSVLLGGTRIGVRRASDPTEATGVHRISRLDQSWLLIPALMFAVLGFYYSGWINVRELKPLRVIGDQVLPPLITVGAWALAWSVANRIAQARFGFIRHLTISLLGVGAIFWFIELVVAPVRFLFHAPPLVTLLLEQGAWLIASWMLGMQLWRVTGWTRRRCMLIAYGLGCSALLVMVFNRVVKADEFDTSLSPGSAALPPAFVIGPVESVDAFLADTVALQQKVDALRADK